MKKLLPFDLARLDLRALAPRGRGGGALLGLTLDGSRLEGVVLRRTNGSLEIKQTFAASLSLDPLTAEIELAGREIRRQLEAAGVRERRCVVGLPLNWVLTLGVQMPDLPEADQQSFLQIEAERGFPYGPESLMLASSRFRLADGPQFATLLAVPREHIQRLEAVLAAAQLRPVSFSLGIAALQRPEADPARGVIALVPAENHLALQITCGGGVVVLRTLEGAFELEGAERRFQADVVLRELRITLGQLPPGVREALQTIRVFGRSETAGEIAEELAARSGALGLRVEQVKKWAADEFGVRLPEGAEVSPALGVAARFLAEGRACFEFLPPRISPWQQFKARYSSPKLVAAGAAAGAVAGLVLLAFLGQQAMLWYWEGQWKQIKARVAELETMQANIRKYRPWFDDSFRSLSILKRLTEAFPEDGTVSAKTVEIREPAKVTCSGLARDNATLLRMLDKLRAAREVTQVQVEQIRGSAPLQFTVNFQWTEGTGS